MLYIPYVSYNVSHCFLNVFGWLVTHWSILTNDAEIREDVALSFGSSLVPHIGHSKLQELLTVSH